MRDFTLRLYRDLVESLKLSGYKFLTFERFLKTGKPSTKTVIMRHDVDKKPKNALLMARLELELGISSSYYFRICKDGFAEEIIKRIAGMKHEIGYHYEDLTRAGGDIKKAIESFGKNLSRLRMCHPVHTICMHGSPLSRWDNRKLWQDYDYRDFGIIGEPYHDIGLKQIFYLTDTGRRWDGDRENIRDKIESVSNLGFHKTPDIIKAVRLHKLPDEIMITTHPQRWTDSLYSWAIELLFQNIKNSIKKIITNPSCSI